MFALLLLGCMTIPTSEVQWLDEYESAWKKAVAEKKDLFIYFASDDHPLETAFQDLEIRQKLHQMVCMKVPYDVEFEGQKLLDRPVFKEMSGKAGFAIMCLSDEEHRCYRELISAHPFVSSRYRWAPKQYGLDELKLVLNLSRKLTLTQRSMLFALHMHPVKPNSIHGTWNDAFMGHAERHSKHQAKMCYQHHADLIGAINRMGGEMGIGLNNGSEVVAESWGTVVGGENVLEACYSCIDAWSHSPGHWGAVCRHHRYFGYDIAKGSNGTWYATGIFAD